MREKPNVVLLGMRGGTAYAVLQALHAMGARVQLICDRRSSIRLSRHCELLYVSRDLSSEPAGHILKIINDRHCHQRVDLVVASDVEGTMLLNGIRDGLTSPVFPAADNATLTLLDNKWSFHRLCAALGLCTPDSIFFESKESIDVARIQSQLGYPVVVKPVDMSGGDGVIVADSPDAVSTQVLLNPRYGYGKSGLIVQRYIRGQDWGYSAFAVDGRIEVALTFVCGPNWRTEFCKNPALLNAGRRIIEHVRYTGVVNCDCRLDDETKTFKFLECNPRFFRRVTAARLCGLNFVKAGICGEKHLPHDICYLPIRDVFTREGVKFLAQGRWPLSVLAADVMETLSDPIPAVVQKGAWTRAALIAISPLLQRGLPARL